MHKTSTGQPYSIPQFVAVPAISVIPRVVPPGHPSGNLRADLDPRNQIVGAPGTTLVTRRTGDHREALEVLDAIASRKTVVNRLDYRAELAKLWGRVTLGDLVAQYEKEKKAGVTAHARQGIPERTAYSLCDAMLPTVSKDGAEDLNRLQPRLGEIDLLHPPLGFTFRSGDRMQVSVNQAAAAALRYRATRRPTRGRKAR